MKGRLTPDAFLSQQPEPMRMILSALDGLITEAAPMAVKKAAPGGLLYTYGPNHIKLSAQEAYIKLTVGSEPLSDSEQAMLSKNKISNGKYTVQFKPGQKIPLEEVSEIILSRLTCSAETSTGESGKIDFFRAPDAAHSEEERAFILAFDEAIQREGYTSDGIQPYVCWGKYVISYYRADVKTKRYAARIFLRSDGLLFRMYFSDIDAHADAIEQLPEDIKAAFFSEYGRCKHCDSKAGKVPGRCMHRKTYSLEGKQFEMCDGLVFLFPNHSVEAVQQYIELLRVFYPPKSRLNK
jgi:hypothetical protein